MRRVSGGHRYPCARVGGRDGTVVRGARRPGSRVVSHVHRGRPLSPARPPRPRSHPRRRRAAKSGPGGGGPVAEGGAVRGGRGWTSLSPSRVPVAGGAPARRTSQVTEQGERSGRAASGTPGPQSPRVGVRPRRRGLYDPGAVRGGSGRGETGTNALNRSPAEALNGLRPARGAGWWRWPGAGKRGCYLSYGAGGTGQPRRRGAGDQPGSIGTSGSLTRQEVEPSEPERPGPGVPRRSDRPQTRPGPTLGSR